MDGEILIRDDRKEFEEVERFVNSLTEEEKIEYLKKYDFSNKE